MEGGGVRRILEGDAGVVIQSQKAEQSGGRGVEAI